MITELNAQFTEINGVAATDIQIAAGDLSVTDPSIAASSFMSKLQLLTINQVAVLDMQTMLTEVESGSLSGGIEMEAEAFMLQLSEFFIVLEGDLYSSIITALSFSFQSISVTLTAEQITIISSYLLTISTILIQITVSMSFYQAQILTLTEVEATEAQILAGDSSLSVFEVEEINFELYKVVYANQASVSSVAAFLSLVLEDSTAATATGTIEVTEEEFLADVMEFNMVCGSDFTVDASATEAKILSSIITFELSVTFIASIEVYVESLNLLAVDMSLTLEVLYFQTIVITGEDVPFVWPQQLATGSTLPPFHFYTPEGSLSPITTAQPRSSGPADKMQFIRALKHKILRDF